MPEQVQLRCANCGTPIDSPAPGVSAVVCPICRFYNTVNDAASESLLTLELLESRLGDLCAQARSSGIANDLIVQVLRDELEFAAEMANQGRDLCVQIMDLGPRAGEPVRRSIKGDSSLLRGRIAGG